MLPCQGQQLEKLIDEALKHSDFHALEELLRDESSAEAHQKCSKNFISKLDRLVNRELNKGNAKHASLCLSCLHRFGKSLTIPGGPLLSGNGTQSLIKKWYGKALELWLEAGPEGNETVLNLAEDFFDALMVVHEANSEGRYQVTESFLHPVGLLAADTRVHIMIQKEAVRKLNIILDKIPSELKKERKMLLSAEVSVVMDKLASSILEGGDYDLQIALMEALCRMTSRAQRTELADRWFTMEFVSSAFCRIQDSEFETDCRKFLNLVNGMQGDKRRVYSYPCLEVFLGKHELVMPMDEKLEEFWIDFNLGSQGISFYFSVSKEDTQEGQWDTLCIPDNEVLSFRVEEARGRKVLVLVLTEPLSVGWAEGSELQIHFSQTLDILQAAINVYGNAKQKRFVGKTSCSVVKTTVQIILDESNSQVLVPESQVSQHYVELRLCGMEKNMSPLLPLAQEEAAGRPLPPPARQHPPQCGTPARRKVSESNTFISSAGRSIGKSPSINVLQATTPMLRAKVKPALELVSSSGKKIGFDIRELMMTQTPESTYCSIRREQSDTFGTVEGRSTRQIGGPLPADKFHRNIPVDRVVEMVQTEQEVEEQLLDDSSNMVPDSQPVWRKQRPLVLPSQELSEPSRKRTSESKLALQERSLPKACAPPAPPPPAPPLGTTSALSQDQCIQLFPMAALQKQRSTTQQGSFQLHAQLTQRLEGLRREREKAGGSAEEEEEDQRAGTVSQTRGRALAREHRDAIWKSAQPMLAMHPSSSGASSLTKKPRKSGPVEVTSCMKGFISSQYKTPTAAPAVRSGTGLALTSVSRCDVYSFQSESPKSCRRKGLRSPEKSIVEKRAAYEYCSSLSVQLVPKRVSPSGRTSTAAKPRGNCARKHLFSDTETEKTDISWLKESGRKPKPKVVDYSRQRTTKPPPPADSTYESDLPPSSSKPPETQAKQKKRKNTGKERKQSAPVAQLCTRPQRTTVLSKNYRELSESDCSSQSECEDLTHWPPKQNQKNRNTKWSVMDQQLELIKNPVPAKERGEKPVTASERGETPITANECGEKPVTASKRLEKPVTASKRVEKPVTGSERGEKPVTANERGEKPVTANECGEKPVTARERGEKPVTASKWEKPVTARERGEKPVTASKWEKPVTANERGEKPVAANEQGGKPITANKIGKKPVTASEKRKKTVTANKQRKRSVTAIKLGEKPFSAIKLGEKPVTAIKLGGKPVSANALGEKPVTAIKLVEKPVTANKRGGKPVTAKPVIVEDQAGGQKELWSARLTDFLPSPPPIERMRSAGESEAVSGSPISPLDSPDAFPLPLQVAPDITGIQASSFYRSERGSSTRKTPSAPSLSYQAVPTPILSPLHPLQSTSPPLLTSTALEPSVPNSPFPEDSLGLPACLDSFKSSSSQSIMLPKLPSSHEQFKEHVSGPGLGRKRPPSHHSSSASEDEEEEEEGRSLGTEQRMSMRPRKLFKAREEEEEEVYSPLKEGGDVRQERVPTVAAPGQGESLADAGRDVEVCSVVSSRVVSSFWEADMEGDGDLEASEFNASKYMSSMCLQFNSELQRKIKNRSRRMDHFSKQSLKTVQQRVSSVSVQIQQYRSQKMEKIKGVLLEEIGNLEQDNSELKNAEKEFTTYWRKQTQAFHSYQERENKRLQNLKSTFQKNVGHSLEYEEQIFTSEMCLMREDMKSVQDKLFKDMQEEEMLSVRRGLQALFLPEGCRF